MHCFTALGFHEPFLLAFSLASILSSEGVYPSPALAGHVSTSLTHIQDRQCTPLHFASHVDVVQRLLQAGADVHAKDMVCLFACLVSIYNYSLLLLVSAHFLHHTLTHSVWTHASSRSLQSQRC